MTINLEAQQILDALDKTEKSYGPPPEGLLSLVEDTRTTSEGVLETGTGCTSAAMFTDWRNAIKQWKSYA